MSHEYNQVLKDFDAKRTRAQTLKHFQNQITSAAQPPSEKQVYFLAKLLGFPGYDAMNAFVRFANCYTYDRLTRVHWIEAISLAKDGRNRHGSLSYLLALSGAVPFGENVADDPGDITPSLL